MYIVNIHEAKAHLSELLARVEAGESVLIARRNKPIAKLVAATEEAPKKKRRLGVAEGSVTIHPSYFEPMDKEELALWETPALYTGDPRHPEYTSPAKDKGRD